MSKIELTSAAIYASLAGAGGAARFISHCINSKNEMCAKKYFILLVSNVFISMFSGLTTALIASLTSTNPTVHLVAASVGGYAGIEIMNIYLNILKSRSKKYE